MELNLEQLAKVNGGVMDDVVKEQIRDFIAVYKGQGSDRSILYTTGWPDEYKKYALLIWDTVK